MKICIIDCIGLSYDGNTLKHRGLGGSESAVILMSKELQKIGFNVTVFNHCIDSQAKPGIYDGVTYRPITDVKDDDYFDIVVSSRTYIPFVPQELQHIFMPDQYGRMHNPASFRSMVSKAKLKILWKHDTFCMGDEYLEKMLIGNYIDEVFTLSDFHSVYVSTSTHGPKRIYEIWKNRIFQTRNGIVNYNTEVDIASKDKNLFVYNASITKGMIPLVTKIWPKVKEKIPDAQLTVIGGYYRFREGAEPDEQEKMFNELVKTNPLGINFTGIISQKEIADILTKASYFIFPNAFPETFGISSLEALNYNVPLLTTRFGAVEETGVDKISYMIDYAIEPNVLAPWINTDEQIDKFVDMVINAYNVPYLHQQKMHMCNIVKDISTWDTVALQWKQHFYRRFNKYLSRDEFKKVNKINNRVHQVFGRSLSNKEDFVNIKTTEKKISVIVPFYNCEQYISKCIDSIATQDYENYECFLINDACTDNTVKVLTDTVMKYPYEIREKFRMFTNAENKGATYNQFSAIKESSGEIIVLIDGDDWLKPDNTIFDYYNNLHDDYDFTYGSCWSMVDNIPLVAQEYPDMVKEYKSYRDYKFNWGMPYTHLRTFKKALFDQCDLEEFLVDGNWPKAGGDNAFFYNIIEKCDSKKIKAVADIHYCYNDVNPLNDYKVNPEEQNKVARKIQMSKKKVLIAIPTAKYIEVETFKSIYDQIIPDGYEVDFQYFFGYNISQIRNLCSDWVIKGYDYLFSVDSDMVFEKDTLTKLLSHDKDIVSGVYRQRKEQQIIEIYKKKNGGLHNVQYEDMKDSGLVEIDGCGFGCVLVKKEVLVNVGYPQFEYHMAGPLQIGLSEDNDFCIKAQNKGHKIYCDTSVVCGHVGNYNYQVK
jgi:glycosyltransferase involved in cell wall biosynthesis